MTRLQVVVLIVVLAALAGLLLLLLFPPGRQEQFVEHVRNTKATYVAKSIVNACKAYEADHVKFPAIAAARDGSAGNEYYSYGDTGEGRCKIDNAELFHVLRAISAGANSGHALNPRELRYFEDAKATDKAAPRGGFTDGPEFPEGMRGRLMDPWGTQYCIVLDADGDAAVNLGGFYSDLAAARMTIRSSVAAFSLGKDGKRGGMGYEGMLRRANTPEKAEDVVSWQ